MYKDINGFGFVIWKWWDALYSICPHTSLEIYVKCQNTLEVILLLCKTI